MRIKGTSISSFLAFLEEEYGASRTRDFIASLDPGLKKRCEGLVLASAFYVYDEMEALARKAKTFFNGDETFFERSGAYNAFFGLTRVHQALLVRATPLDFLKAFERSWSQFIDSGTMNVELADDGDVQLSVEGLPASEIFCARLTGFIARSMELAQAKSLVVTKLQCVGKGEGRCLWSVVWDPRLSPQSQSHTVTSAIRRPVTI